MSFSSLTKGIAIGTPHAHAATVLSTGAGPAFTLPHLLGSASVFSLGTLGTTNANLTLSGGVISRTAAIGAGVSQIAYIREANTTTKVAQEYPLTLTGAAAVLTAPAAPSLSAVAGNGQVTLTWTDGGNGGSAITQRLLFMGTTPGGEGAGAPITLTGGQYIVTGLTNGQPYYFEGACQNAIGTSLLSTEPSATPTPAISYTPALKFNDARNSMYV